MCPRDVYLSFAHAGTYLFLLLLLIDLSPALSVRDRSFARAQCTAHCLKEFAAEVWTAARSAKNNSIVARLRTLLLERPDLALPRCMKETALFPNCKTCVERGCSTSGTACAQLCQKNRGCLSGCLHLSRALSNRPGACPTPSLGSPPLSGCYRSCRADSDCRIALQKCCPSGCGSVCQAPVYNASIPKVVPPLRIWEFESKRKIDLEWRYPRRSVVRGTFEPIVFVVQIRDYAGSEFNDRMARAWHTLLTTTVTAVSLDEMSIGTFYQFRIAAVSQLGTRGFQTLSTPVRLSKAPRSPTAPRNVSDGVWRIHAGGSINVQINWAPPEISDFPISSYKINWVQDHGFVQYDGKSLESLTRYGQIVPGDRLQYTIENLLPQTSYKVQVIARAKWGERELESPPHTLFVTTPRLHSAEPAVPNSGSRKESDVEEGRCVCNQQTTGLFVYKPIFEEGRLSVKILLTKVTAGEDRPYLVEWSPKVCIATSKEDRLQSLGNRMKSTMQNRVKVISDLAFNCRYWLRVSPLEQPHREAAIASCFCTPACRDANVAKNSRKPKCSPDTTLPVPPRPTNISVRRIGRRSFAISWSRSPSWRSFNKFRVVWGPREEEPVNKDMYGDSGLRPKIDFDRAETKVVGRNVTTMILKNLLDATFYIVKIQALTYRDGRESESQEGVYYFTTQGFRNPPTVHDYHAVVSEYVKDPARRRLRLLAGLRALPQPMLVSGLLIVVLLHLLLVRDFT